MARFGSPAGRKTPALDFADCRRILLCRRAAVIWRNTRCRTGWYCSIECLNRKGPCDAHFGIALGARRDYSVRRPAHQPRAGEVFHARGVGPERRKPAESRFDLVGYRTAFTWPAGGVRLSLTTASIRPAG